MIALCVDVLSLTAGYLFTTNFLPVDLWWVGGTLSMTFAAFMEMLITYDEGE